MNLDIVSEKMIITESEYIAQNLSSLLKKNNLNANQLAQILNIPMMTIRRLLSGETTDPRISTLKLIANHFNVSIDSIITEHEQRATIGSMQSKPHFVPILSWDVAERIESLNDIDLNTWENWQSIAIGIQEKISKNAFALESRPSMYPRFPQGTVFIIDPDESATDGDIVLVKIKKRNELTLRNLVIDAPEWQLHPVIAGSSIINFSHSDHKLIGVNLLMMLYNRRS